MAPFTAPQHRYLIDGEGMIWCGMPDNPEPDTELSSLPIWVYHPYCKHYRQFPYPKLVKQLKLVEQGMAKRGPVSFQCFVCGQVHACDYDSDQQQFQPAAGAQGAVAVKQEVQSDDEMQQQQQQQGLAVAVKQEEAAVLEAGVAAAEGTEEEADNGSEDEWESGSEEEPVQGGPVCKIAIVDDTGCSVSCCDRGLGALLLYV